MTAVKDIQLTKAEIRLLKKISKYENINWSDSGNAKAFKTLQYYSLVTYPYRTITERGKQFLLWQQNASAERRREHRHNWYIAIFSTLSGALLSKPIWAGIDFIIKWIGQIL